MIKVKNLTKSFSLGKSRHYVFRDVSFELPDKTNIGILGPNGAGKSTLLRILGGIDHPDSGSIETNSSISWPLGLRGGFVRNMSGRENCRMICNAYGVKLQDISDKLDYVKNLSGIGEYFEEPVAYYSSGMSGRLGFALSMAFDFDYFLIDEITSVGDAQFKQIAKEALDEKAASCNVIMVSHSMNDLKRFCDVAVLIKDGRVTVFENWDDALYAYIPKTQPTVKVGELTNVTSEVAESRALDGTSKVMVDLLNNANEVLKDSEIKLDPDVLVKAANAYLQLRSFSLAHKCISKAFEIENLNITICSKKASLEGSLGKLDEQQKTIEQGLKLDPLHPNLNFEKARNFFALADYEGAVQAALLALSVAPENASYWTILSLSYLRDDKFQNAYDAALKGLEYQPQNASLKNVRIESLQALGYHELAVEFLKESLDSSIFEEKTEQAITNLESIAKIAEESIK